jgi:hypothetical protein
MEKQMQYSQSGQKVEWITPEEWLMFQDLPNKEYMLERMGIQRNSDYVDKVSQVIFQYAELTQNGMPPEQALVATANTLQQSETPRPQGPAFDPEQAIPDVAAGMSP